MVGHADPLRPPDPLVGSTIPAQGITVLVCDGEGALRDALREALHDVAWVGRAAAAASVAEAGAEAARLKPEVAVIADHLPDGGPLAAVRAIREGAPGCAVALLARWEDTQLLLGGIRIGVRGFLMRDSRLTEFVAAIRNVFDGAVVISPRMMGAVWEELVGPHAEPVDELLARLTTRERQVLLLLAEGANKDAIALALFISPKTARTHLQNIFSKLGVRSKLEAVAVAIQEDRLRELRSERPV